MYFDIIKQKAKLFHIEEKELIKVSDELDRIFPSNSEKELKYLTSGESSLVFSLKDKIIKVSFTEYDNCPLLKEYVSHSKHIIQPEAEERIDIGKEYGVHILKLPCLNTNNISMKDVLNTYVGLRNDGYLWYDIRMENLGKDKNGKVYLLDYGELFYLNYLNDYKKTELMKVHQEKCAKYDRLYNNLYPSKTNEFVELNIRKL